MGALSGMHAAILSTEMEGWGLPGGVEHPPDQDEQRWRDRGTFQDTAWSQVLDTTMLSRFWVYQSIAGLQGYMDGV
jgi:hypothetical protein